MVATIVPDNGLLSRDFLHRLGRRVVELELSRMKSTDWLATVLYGWDGVILDADGTPFEIDDEMIDFSYGRDASGSCNTEVNKFGQRMPSRRPRKRLKLRLQHLDAAFKIVSKPVMECERKSKSELKS